MRNSRRTWLLQMRTLQANHRRRENYVCKGHIFLRNSRRNWLVCSVPTVGLSGTGQARRLLITVCSLMCMTVSQFLPLLLHVKPILNTTLRTVLDTSRSLKKIGQTLQICFANSWKLLSYLPAKECSGRLFDVSGCI